MIFAPPTFIVHIHTKHSHNQEYDQILDKFVFISFFNWICCPHLLNMIYI